MTRRLRFLALGGSLLLAAGCATTTRQPAPPAAPPEPAAHVATPSAPPPPPQSTPIGFWDQMRQRLVLDGCRGQRVQRWIDRYSRHPRPFQARMRQDLPKLRYVAALAAQRGIPADFALLPWVESNFRALPSQGNRPAGMWQIMPATGRSLGLRIDRRYDGRLDLHESSIAALQLLAANYDEFRDWRLADMAYNTGRYRIKRLLAEQDGELGDRAVPELPVSDITRDHLAKLTALACVVADPDRYGIDLPEPVAAYNLIRTKLPISIDLRIAARFSGLSLDALRELNAAWRDYPAPVRDLVLPQAAAQVLTVNIKEVKRRGWLDWQRMRVEQPTILGSLPTNAGGAALLGKANARGTATSIPVGALLWLPRQLAADNARFAQVDEEAVRDTHLVKTGDTLWDLARRFGVTVANLRAWNGLVGTILRPGQKLRLTPP